jgi:hypothetical protein
MRFRRLFEQKLTRFLVAALGLAGVILGVIVANAADPGVASKIDYAIDLNGADTYVRTDSQVVPNNSSFTVESYFKIDAANANHGWIWSVGLAGDSGSNWGALIAPGTTARGSCLYIASPDGYSPCVGTRSLVPVNDWVHLAVTYDSTQFVYRAFVNGVELMNRSVSNTAVRPGFSIGRAGGSSDATPLTQQTSLFTGQIDEVKVFNNVRSQANILLDTYTYLSPSTSGLVAMYDFNEGATGGGKIYDRTSNNNDLSIFGNPTFSDIAQHTVTSRAIVTRFNRSYLTANGGWSAPGGVSVVSGNAYGGGGGGGGGATEAAGSGGGGGGAAAGARTTISNAVSPNSNLTVRVGLGGPGGQPGPSTGGAGLTGTSGQQSTFISTTAAGGAGGFGGGLASGTATYTAGLGGKGANSPSGNQGSTITTSNDGGGAGGLAAAVANNVRLGAAGVADSAVSGVTFIKPGDGGLGGATTNSLNGTNGTAATGAGGSGGSGNTGSTLAWAGGFGANGSIVLTYNITSPGQNADILYTFNGVNQWAETILPTTALNDTGDLTLQAWVNPTNACPVGFCTIAGRDNNYLLGTSNGTYWWRITNSDGSSNWYNTGVSLAVGHWQHVSLVRSGTTVLLYINGQLMSTQATGSNDASGTPITLTATSAVGQGWFQLASRGVDHVDDFAGGIDEVRVWSVARTAAEIGDASTGDFNRSLNTTELASANLLAYWDMNDNVSNIFVNRKTGASAATDLTPLGSPTSVVNGASSQILNRYLTVTSSSNTAVYGADDPSFELTGSNFTISGWWQITSCASQNYLVSKADTYAISTDSSCRINIQLDAGNEGTSPTAQWMNTGYMLALNTWRYVSVIKVGTTVYLYVDGTLASTINDGDTVQTLNNAGNITASVPANLGNRNTFFGVGSTGVGTTRSTATVQNIDDIRLWNTDRRTNQTLDMVGFVPHTVSGLQAMFDFNTLTQTALTLPNMASLGSSESYLTTVSSLTNQVSSITTPPSNQPIRQQQYIQRSIIRSSNGLGTIPSGSTSAEYWLAGGGGGGGTGGNSGYTGAGGGAGGFVEGVAVGIPNGVLSETVTTMRVGAGGAYAINNGDAVTQGARNGTSTAFITTGVSATAPGGGAGGSGTTNPAGAPQGQSGGSGGGSGQTGGAGGAATNGFAGGAGSALASGGGGGARSAGGDASGANGGAGGKGILLPLTDIANNRTPVWVLGGGGGFGTNSGGSANTALGATAANSDAAAASGSGGGGAGFASASTGTSRGGYGASGFILINHFMAQPIVDSAPTSLQSGQPSATALSISTRDINGNVLTSNSSIALTAVSGCTLVGSYSGTTVAGRITFSGLNATGTDGTCQLRVSNTGVSPNATFTFSLPIKGSPASITVSTSATTGTCSFQSGLFACPDGTVATLNVNDLNTQLNTNDVTLVTRTGDITINSAITGSTGALTLSSSGAVRLNAPITLNGAGKALTVRSLNQIIGNESATSSSPTTFTTNGGAINLYPGFSTQTTAGFVKLSNYNNFVTNGGAFNVSGGPNPATGFATGDQAAGPSSITANGIYFATGATVSTGAGDVTLRGQLWGSRTQYNTPSGWAAGIGFAGSNSITTTSGNVSLTGNCPNMLYDQAYRAGITMNTTSISTGSGSISLSADTSSDSVTIWGAAIWMSGSNLTSASGNITVTGNAPTGNNSVINFNSPQSTFGSDTGNVTVNAPASVLRTQVFGFLKLTGGGTHTISFIYPTFPTTAGSMQAFGSGDIVITAPATSNFSNGVSIPAQFDFGTSYRTITIGDNPSISSNSKNVTIDGSLVASQYVSLMGLNVQGSGGVTAPGLAIQVRGTSGSNAQLAGASDVTTLAINHPQANSTTNMGISDANGWTPGDVAGVTAVYGVARSVVMLTQPSSSVVRNQVFPTQPVVSIVDAYIQRLTAGNLTNSNYTIAPSISSGTPTTAVTPTTSVGFVAGAATFSGLKLTSTGTFGIRFTVSPTLAGTNTLTTSTTATAAGSPATISLSPTSINATSGVAFSPQPTLTYLDIYGNTATSASGVSANPTATITSGPSGGTLSGGYNTTTSGVATGNNFRITGPTGTYVITFTGTVTGTTTSTQTLTINLTGWSVGYGGTSLGYSTTTYPATFSGNGTGAVTYSSSTTGVCTVNSSTGALTTVALGTCTITANQATDGTNPAGSASVTLTIVKGTQSTITVSSNPASLVYGSSVTLSGSGGNGTGAFTYQKVSGNCTVTGTTLAAASANAGETCVVTATKATDTLWNAATSANTSFTVAGASQAAVTVPTGQTVRYASTVDLTQSPYTPSGGSGPGAWQFSTSSPNCSINGNLLTTSTAVGGTCVVTVVKAGNGNFADSTPVDMTLTTVKGNQTVGYVTVASSVRVGESTTVSATSSSGLTVTYSIASGSNAFCTITGNTVTFTAAGTCAVNANQAGDANYNAASTQTLTYTVAKGLQSITLNQIANDVVRTTTLTASATASSGLAVTYSTGPNTTNSSCSVSSSGVISLNAIGVCEVVASQAGDSNYEAAADAVVTFSIAQGTQSALSITSSSTVAYGNTITLTASGGNGSSSYSWSATGDCTVAGNILTVGDAGSNCVVSVDRAADANWFAATTATQTVTITKANQATLAVVAANSVVFGNTILLNTSGGSGPGAVTYSTTGTCTESGGLLTLGDAGSNCSVTATKAGSLNYNSATSAAFSIAVTRAQQAAVSITSGNSVAYGSTLQLSATGGTGSGSISYSTTGTCSVSGSTLTPGNAGSSCTVTATRAQSTNYLAESSATMTITVTKANQSITFTSSPSTPKALGSYTVAATADSGLTVSFTIAPSSSSVCSLSGSVVSFATSGSCVILADQAGNSNFEPAAQQSQTVTVGLASQSITFNNPGTKQYGDAAFAPSASSNSGLTLVFTVGLATTNSACSIDGQGRISIDDVGTCQILADQPGNNVYDAAAQASVTFVIGKGNQATLTITSASSVVYGNTISLTTSGGSGTGAVTYTTSGTCSVSGSTLTVGNAGSSCTVTATKATDAQYLAASSSAQTVSITKANQVVTITSSPGSATALGTYALTATSTSGEAATFTIDSNSASVCSLSGLTVTYLTSGVCTIFADQGGNTNFNAATQTSQNVTVGKASQTITLTSPGQKRVGDASFNAGATTTSSLQIAYSLGSSTTNNACTVSPTGQVTVLAVGDCEIEADQAGNNTYNPATTARVTFAIAQGNQAALTISSANSVAFGNTISLTTSGGSGTGAVTYATTGTCSVSGSTLTVGDAGSACTVTATKSADTNYLAESSTAQTVTITRANQSALSISSASSVAFGDTITLATSGGSGTGAVTYSTTGTCSETNGVLTVGDAGSACTVTATKAQSTNFTAATSATQTITITKANQTVSFSTSPVLPTANGSYSVAATADSGLSVAITVDSGSSSVCSISGSTVSFVTSGSCVLNANQAGNTNFNPASQVQQTITVAKAAQSISLTNPGDQAFGGASFSISGSASSGLALTYSLGSATTNSACSVTSGGTVTISQVGTCEILANQSGDATYSAAPQASVSFAIAKANQAALSMSSASTVTFGGTISLTTSGGSGTGAVTYSTTGTCSVSGSTLTVGDAGSACTVTATKAADSDYNSASSSAQTVTVTKAAQTISLSPAAGPAVALGSNVLTVSASSGLQVALTVDASTASNCSLTGTTVSFLRSGSCLINADQAGNTNFDAASQVQQTFTIAKAAQTISITAPGTVRFGDAAFSIAATASSGLAITYSTGTNTTNSACSVASNGTVTINDVGDCEVTANQSGDSVYDAATATSLTFQVAKGYQAALSITSANSVTYGGTISLTTSGGSGQGTISFVTGGTCSVSGSTLTVGVAGSACTVTATKAADSQYLAASSAAQTVTVLRASQPTLSMSSASSVAFGDTLTLLVSGGAGTGALTYSTTGTCSEAGGILTVGAVGSACTVTATKAASANYESATSATQTITVVKANQQPLIITSASSGLYGALILPTVSGGSGGGAVTYSVTGSGCTMFSGQVFLTAATLPCDLTATKAGSANYNAVTSSVMSITIYKASQTITVAPAPNNARALGAFTPFATANSGLQVTYSIDASTSSVCRVRMGSIEFLTSGTCLVNYDQVGDINVTAATQVQQSITVGKAAQTISFPQISTKRYLDSAFQAQAYSDSGLPITYSLGVHTTNNSCSVTSTGLISILDVGFCEIYADQAGDGVYSPANMASQNFSIDRTAQAAVSLTNASTVAHGSTLTLSATGGSGTGAFSYSVSAGTCSISGSTLTVGDAGSLCQVFAVKARDSQFADEASPIMTITVTRSAQASFSISSASSVAFGGTITLATSGGSGTGAVTYATTGTCSETSGILTVGDAGSACTVTATKAQSTNFNAATSVTQTITITKSNQSVTFTTTPTVPTANGSYSVAATADSGLSVAITVDSGSTAVCSISGSTVSFLTSGSCVLNANQAGNTNFNPASQVQQTITVAKAAQTISLTNPGTKQFGASAFSIAGSASSGLALTYSLGSQTTNSACSVASNGTVSISGVGTCEVLADQAGDSTYSAATQASVSFSVGKTNQAALTISSASTVAFGGTISLTTSGGSGTGAVTYSTTGTCSVSGSTLTVGDAGSACTVTATKAGDSDYFSATSASQTVTVTRAAQATLTVAMSSTQAYGTSQLLNFAGGSGSGAVTYSATGTCSISGSSLTIGAVGTNCSVTATKAQSQNYSAATSVAFSIAATKVQQTISFTTSTSTATAFGTYSVAAAATSGLSVSIGVASASSSVCSISGSTVTFLTGGSCVLEANQAGDGNYDPAPQALQTLTVATAAQTISFSRPADLANGSSAVQLAANASSALPVSYSLGGGTTNGACTVTSSGAVTPVAVGTCEIVVSQVGNPTYSAAIGVTRSFEITRANQSALSIASAASVTYGSTISLSTTGGSGNGAVTYSTTGTCSVSGSTLTVGDAGSACSVTATKAQDANYFATTSPAQTVTVTRANQATLSIASLSSMTYGQSLALVSTGGSGSGGETWSVDTSANANIAGCQINNSNATLGVQNAGTCDIIVRKAASTNFNQATSAAFTVTATKAAQNINFTSTVPVSPVPGGSYNLAATANSGLAVTFTLDSGSSAFCSLSGSTVTFNSAGNCVVNASQSGDNRYLAAATASQTIVIGSLNQTITFANLINRTFGDPSFTLGATVPSTSPVTYALGGGTTNSACSVSTVGLVNVLNIGRCEIVASAQGDSRYAAASSVTRAFDVVADRPGAPFITSVSAGNASVTVAFTAPGYTGGAAISGYDINAYRNGILVSTGSNCASNATTCTITGLTNGHTYTIKMAAVNAAGSGAESAASGNVTPYTRPEAVGALAAVASNNAIALSWQQPTSMGGGTFVSYQIFVRTHGGTYPQTPTATVNSSSSTTYSLTNLTNGQAYDIKVVTITTASSTQLTSNTAEVQQTPMTVPDAPQQLTIIETQVDGVVDVSWAAPTSNGGSPITGYTVDLGQGHSCTVSGNATSCTISNLTSSTTYNVSAYATNAAGNSLNTGTVITLRVGTAVTSSGPAQFTAAFGLTVERVTAFASIDTTDRKQVSTAGGSRIVIAGFNLDKVTRVTVDGRPVIIISKTSSAMLLQLPGSENPGWADLWFYAPNASLRYVDGIYYSTAKIYRPLTRVIYGFVTVQKKIIPWQKALIKSAVVKAGPAKSVTCTGVRANAALTCAIVKQMNPKLTVKIVPTKPKKNTLAATVVKTTFNY